MSAQPTPTLTHLSSAFEPDMDSFFDLEENDITPSLSPVSARPESQRASMVGQHGSSFGQRQQPLSGPSHQYDAYRQQTGLPAGGLASTFAVNRATGMQYTPSSSGFVMPVETLNFPLPSNDDFDFNANPSYDMSDMDFEADSPAESLPAMFYPGKTQFVNPSTISGESSSTYTPQVQRMYPGMHAQQAAQAAQAKKQQELARQQHQPRIPEGQRPLPSQKDTKGNDPVVDERISRLLQQMRHNSAVSIEEDQSQSSSGLPQMSKLKKEEEEMDEDERLLASEEGKKLSSKERRQLRNKVSARAFRSRRKEYIGQLEGEVAAKTQEANDLRVENRQLMEENNRLTDLTRMLLSSPAFSGFLNELSANGGSVPSALQKATGAQQAPQQHQQPLRKDINPHQVARQLQNQQQVGMVMVPEPQVDLSTLNLNAQHGWNSGIDVNAFQVFAVTELPEGPAIDVNVLSGKSSTRAESKPVLSKELPSLPSVPVTSEKQVEEPKVNNEVELDASLSLFEVTSPVKSVSPSQSLVTLPCQKPQHFELITVTNFDSTTAAAALEKMCTDLDENCARLECFTSHL